MTQDADTRGQPLWLGLERVDITCFEPGMSMWGWGSPANVAVAAETRLFARALVMSEGEHGRPVAIVAVELGMVSESIRRGVLRDLLDRGVDVDEHRLAITATHTHSGPSGFSTYLFYALAGPGFSHRVHDTIVKGIADAVARACAKRQPGRAYQHAIEIPLVEPVAFNRSLRARNRNHDVDPLGEDRADEAVDRRMVVLRFEDTHGRGLGLLSSFAVHGTSVHADNDRLHADNKGVAALECENALDDGNGFVALFVQGAAGDVTPNYRPCPRRGFTVGRYDDDLESAAHNGCIQARYAIAAHRAARAEGHELAGVGARLRYVAFDDMPVDADLGVGSGICKTGGASLGLAFCAGTREGPGPLGPVAGFARTLTTLLGMRAAGAHDARAAAHGRKAGLWDLGPGARNRIGGALSSNHPATRLLAGRRMQFYRDAQEYRGVRVLPWVPHNLPFQIITLGGLAMAFLPFEPTTIAGRRIAAVLKSLQWVAPLREAIVVGYSNAYASYLTTPEEYDEQAYEGGATLFGKWSLPAACSVLRNVARLHDARAPEHDLGDVPPRVPVEHWLPCVGEPERRVVSAPSEIPPAEPEPTTASIVSYLNGASKELPS